MPEIIGPNTLSEVISFAVLTTTYEGLHKLSFGPTTNELNLKLHDPNPAKVDQIPKIQAEAEDVETAYKASKPKA